MQYAYVITLCGLILSFLGWRAFRFIAVPILILLFMIPLPQFVLANLSTKLQLLSSQIGVVRHSPVRYQRLSSRAMSSTSAATSCKSRRPAADCATCFRS